MADSKQNNSEKKINCADKTCQGRWISEEYEPGLVSVIIPTYNRAQLVTKAIDSVLSQTYKDFEIIVVDDGSTDNTEEVVGSFKDSRIHYIRHKENRGGSAARNTGIKASKGEYIAFLDSDDEWLRSKLEKQLRVFYKGDAKLGAVGTGRVTNYPNNKSVLKIPSENFGNIYKRFLKGRAFPGGTPTMMIKRECFGRIGLFDELLESCQDFDLYFRIAKHYHFYVVRELLVKCTLHTFPGISLNTDAKLQGKRRILLKYSKEIPRLNRLRGRFNFAIGTILCRQNKIKEGRRYLLRAVLAYPFTLKYWVNFFFSIFPCYEYLLFKRTWLRRKSCSERQISNSLDQSVI